MPLATALERTEEFELDRAFHGVSDATLARIERALLADPSRGAMRPETPGALAWETDGLRVTYQHHVFDPTRALILMLRIVPVDEVPPDRREQLDAVLRVANGLKRLLLHW